MRQDPKEQWNLYIAECADGSYYTGITKDVEKRIATHNEGKGSKYAAAHAPVRLVYQETQADYSAALRREYQVKSLPKERKTSLIAGESLDQPSEKAKMSFARKQRKKNRRQANIRKRNK